MNVPDDGRCPLTAFFDTNVWSDFYRHDDIDLRTDQRRGVQLAARQGKLLVLGSPEVLAELGPIAIGSTTRYKKIRKLFFATVGGRVLRETRQLIIDELTHSPPVQGACYFRPDDFTCLERTARDMEWVMDRLGGDSSVNNYVRDENERRETFRSRFAEQTNYEGNASTTVGDWWQSGPVEDWAKDYLRHDHAAKARLLHAEDEWPNPRSLPSLWNFISYRLARLNQTLSDGRKIDRGDFYDAHHYAKGHYYDVLVTGDRRLRETAALIPDRPVEVLTLEELLQRVVTLKSCESPQSRNHF